MHEIEYGPIFSVNQPQLPKQPPVNCYPQFSSPSRNIWIPPNNEMYTSVKTAANNPADGVGAEVKRSVWMAVLRGSAVINNAEEFFNVAKNKAQKIVILYLEHSKIEKQREMLNTHWNKMSRPISGTHALHYVNPVAENGTLRIYKNSVFITPSTEAEDVCDSQQCRDDDCTVYSSKSSSIPSASESVAPVSEIVKIGSYIVVDYLSGKKKQSYVGQVSAQKK